MVRLRLILRIMPKRIPCIMSASGILLDGIDFDSANNYVFMEDGKLNFTSRWFMISTLTDVPNF